MIPNSEEFLLEIQKSNLGLTQSQMEKAAQFAHILHRENEVQNLTRILGVKEFVEGHLLDVVELLKAPSLGMRVLDIGSGSGVPGLLAAAIDLNPDRLWFLTESERSKAEYLSNASIELDLPCVSVHSRRVEEVIQVIEPDTVIARAVGTVEKIALWIWNCSTWNNLVLFKSRGWAEEWTTAKLSKFGKKLTVTHMQDYSSAERARVLITLSKKVFG